MERADDRSGWHISIALLQNRLTNSIQAASYVLIELLCIEWKINSIRGDNSKYIIRGTNTTRLNGYTNYNTDLDVKNSNKQIL